MNITTLKSNYTMRLKDASIYHKNRNHDFSQDIWVVSKHRHII